MAYPSTHITDSLRIVDADARIDLFELYPSIGSGTIYFTFDDTKTWLGNEYIGLPIKLSGEKDTSDGPPPAIRLEIGDPNLDFAAFKALIRTGALDNAYILRKRVLGTHLSTNTNIFEPTGFTATVEHYNRTGMSLLLEKGQFRSRSTFPFRRYLPPAFPFVRIN